MCCLVALESVAQVMFVVHVTLGAQVIVKAHFAFPTHSHDTMLFAAVTDDVGMAHTWRHESGGERKPGLPTSSSLFFVPTTLPHLEKLPDQPLKDELNSSCSPI